jgi:hypothetical protein
MIVHTAFAVVIFRVYISECYNYLLLGGSLVTTAWRVLRLRMEGTASRYGA